MAEKQIVTPWESDTDKRHLYQIEDLRMAFRLGHVKRDGEVAQLRGALELVATFGKEHPWTGLGDSKGYGADLRKVAQVALKPAGEVKQPEGRRSKDMNNETVIDPAG